MAQEHIERTTLRLRKFLKFKDGNYKATVEVLEHPDTWSELTPESQRFVKRYAAKIGNGGAQQKP